MPTSYNPNDCVIRLTGRWTEGRDKGQIDDHIADGVTVNLALVTNTPEDYIPLASLWVTVFGDGFFLISRTRVGGGSEYVASGSLDAIEGTKQYGEAHASLHKAPWTDNAAPAAEAQREGS
jgi:hypothetical protein